MSSKISSSASAEYNASSDISPASTKQEQSVEVATASLIWIPFTRPARWLRKFYGRLVRPWWAWEISAAIVSLIATISLVIVLSQVDRREQTLWPIGGTLLTINTVVAGIGTVLRTALLLAVAGALNQSAWNWFASSIGKPESEGRPLRDLETFSDASANSWNCIKLLWRTKFRYMVTIGALVMILSLAFDAFLQQILSTGQQPQQIKMAGPNLTESNILSRSTFYNDNTSAPVEQLENMYWTTIMTASFVQDIQSLPNAVCPTGKCSWPVTPSLATCHACESFDSVLQKNTTQQNSDGACNSTTYYLPASFSKYNGLNINTTIVQCKDGAVKASWEMIPDYAANYPGYEASTIVRFYSLGIPPQTAEGPLRDPLPIAAYNCSIQLCVKGYTGFLSDGSYHETTIEEIGRESQYAYDKVDNALVEIINIPAALNMLGSDVMTIDRVFLNHLGYDLGEFLQGGVNMSFVPNKGPRGVSTYSDTTDLEDFLWNAGGSLENFTTVIGILSDGITQNIRATSRETPSPLYAPTVTVEVTIVVVRWPWLIYVLVLQFSGLIFLALTMRSTRRRRIRAWKGHRMALLLAELDPGLQYSAQGGLSHRTGLDDRIGDTNVRLEFDGDDKIVFRCVDQEQKHRRTVGLEFGTTRSMVPYEGV